MIAKRLKRRLADIAAAVSANELIAGKLAFTGGNPHELMLVQLGEGLQLVLAANHNEIPLLKNGAVDWSNVSRIKVVGIEANHD